MRGEKRRRNIKRQIILKPELLRVLQAKLATDWRRNAAALPSFGPDALKTIGEAFDGAWAEIEDAYGTDPAVIEAGRFKLANTLLSIANNETRDVEALKSAALRRMSAPSR